MPGWYFKDGSANWRPRFKASHLSYTSRLKVQCKATVKVHGVFPSAADTLHLHSDFNFTESRGRQRRHRYAIRAGRNLPDKEFRYLRTVIVTAAVYRGFDQELRLR